MTNASYWWAALCVAGVIAVHLADDPAKPKTNLRVMVFWCGIGSAVLGIAGLLHELWRFTW